MDDVSLSSLVVYETLLNAVSSYVLYWTFLFLTDSFSMTVTSSYWEKDPHYPKYHRAVFWDIHCHNCDTVNDYYRSIIVCVRVFVSVCFLLLTQHVGWLFRGRGSSSLLLDFNLWPSALAKPYWDHTLPHTAPHRTYAEVPVQSNHLR